MNPSLFLLIVALLLLLGAAIIHRNSQAEQVSGAFRLARAMGKLMAGEKEEVLQEMRELYRETEQEPAVGLALGTLLRHVGKHQTAIRTHKSLLIRSGQPKDFKALVHTELSSDFLELGLLGRAATSLEEAVATNGVDAQRARLGELIYTRLERWDQAISLITTHGKRSGKDVRPRLGMLRYLQGERLWEQDRRDEAFTAWKKATSVDKGCYPAYLASSRFYREGGRVDKAIKLIHKNMAHFEGNTWLAFDELRRLAIQANNNDLIFEPLLQHLDRDPEDWRSRRVLTLFLMETGRHEEAAEHLIRCLHAYPRGLVLHEQLRLLVTRSDQPWDVFEEYHGFLEQDKPFRQAFECQRCGFSTGEMLWWCPSCNHAYSFVEKQV